ncbi:hypothetical protein DXG01_012096 [Tephrocybe rancida]|nr:hypothetical protein DXG01_012096 [Tephrocybe rancida]
MILAPFLRNLSISGDAWQDELVDRAIQQDRDDDEMNNELETINNDLVDILPYLQLVQSLELSGLAWTDLWPENQSMIQSMGLLRSLRLIDVLFDGVSEFTALTTHFRNLENLVMASVVYPKTTCVDLDHAMLPKPHFPKLVSLRALFDDYAVALLYSPGLIHFGQITTLRFTLTYSCYTLDKSSSWTDKIKARFVEMANIITATGPNLTTLSLDLLLSRRFEYDPFTFPISLANNINLSHLVFHGHLDFGLHHF